MAKKKWIKPNIKEEEVKTKLLGVRMGADISAPPEDEVDGGGGDECTHMAIAVCWTPLM
ncbi:MAG: hypothetical protein ISS47_01745 [Candidatus Omnitrophica bacterium]|nr:hypothetical protein [Candidatus Omnitrophota bacterium]